MKSLDKVGPWLFSQIFQAGLPYSSFVAVSTTKSPLINGSRRRSNLSSGPLGSSTFGRELHFSERPTKSRFSSSATCHGNTITTGACFLSLETGLLENTSSTITETKFSDSIQFQLTMNTDSTSRPQYRSESGGLFSALKSPRKSVTMRKSSCTTFPCIELVLLNDWIT